ncbi:MAG: DNA repair protein RecO [Chromatiales bacterium]|jgi:DNA repair protein RecO (recombination protein O)
MTPAYVLHRRDYSDNSLLLDLFTLDHGRQSVIARGVKSGKRKKSAILQPFLPLIISLSGRGEVKTLRDAEATEKPLSYSGDRLYSAYYLNELVIKFLQQTDVNQAAFVHYAHALSELQQAQTPEIALRRFELALLDAVGFGLELAFCNHGQTPIEAVKQYRYEMEQGPVEGNSGNGPKLLGQTLLHMHQGRFEDELTLRQAKQLMRYAISHYLDGYHFKSREFFTTSAVKQEQQ